MTVQPDGKILVVGTDGDADPKGDVRLTRYRLDGSLDNGFGTGGTTHTDRGFVDGGNAVTVAPDGRIVVVGESQLFVNDPNRLQSFAARYSPDGTLDPSFGDAGIAVLDEGPALRLESVALQADGKVLVGGEYLNSSTVDSPVLRRFNADGSFDGGFGDGTWPDPLALSHDLPGGNVLAVRSMADGTIMVAGSYGLRPGVFGARMTVDGHLDASYGSHGTLTVPGGTPAGILAKRATVLADGSIVFAGSLGSDPASPPFEGRAFGVSRFTPDGSVDPAFGVGGVVSSSVVSFEHAQARSIAPEPDGSLTVWGDAHTDSPTGSGDPSGQVFAAHLSATGAFDREFGAGGIATFAAGGQALAWAGSMAMQVDGRPVMVGFGRNPGASVRTFLLRLQGPGGAAATVRSAGLNVFGQLGDATTTTGCAVVATAGLYGTFAPAAGAFHSLALAGDGTVKAWGYNQLGQLGDGSVQSRATPLAVPGLSDVVAIAAGAYHSLALRNDGTVWAWGWNAVGQLGDGTTVDRHFPVRVTGLTGVVAIAAGFYHSAALRSDGTVLSWGWNGFGQLGDATATTRLAPVAVPGLRDVRSVSAGAFHTRAVTNDGRVRAWGYNGFGQLGDGTTTDRRTPVPVVGASGMSSVAGGAWHSLALRSDGSVAAWGYNSFGELGDGTTVERHAPVAVHTRPITALAAGYLHSVALGTDGSVQSWGYNGFCQLGDATNVDRSIPATVAGPGAAAAVSAGGYHTLFSAEQ